MFWRKEKKEQKEQKTDYSEPPVIQKVLIAKHAMKKRGIFSLRGAIVGGTFFEEGVSGDGIDVDDYFLTMKDTVKEAERLLEKQRVSLRKKLAKLDSTSFNEDGEKVVVTTQSLIDEDKKVTEG